MKKFGIKLWSTDFIKNPQFAHDAENAVKSGKFEYIELFAQPSTYDDTYMKVSALKGIPIIIHAPHSKQGFDPSNPDEFANNQKKFKDSQRFADLLDAKFIVTHPGFKYESSRLEENIRQFKALKDNRIAVENLPCTCTSTNRDIEGYSADYIKKLKEEVQCHFCLDFAHAICAANANQRDIYEVLSEFTALNPDMYHLSDGFIDKTIDEHLNYGKGNYEIGRLLNDYTTADAFITMETANPLPLSLTPWLKDVEYLRHLLK